MRKWEFLAEVGQVVRLLYCEHNGRFYYRLLGKLASVVATDEIAIELARRKVRVLPDTDFILCYHCHAQSYQV